MAEYEGLTPEEKNGILPYIYRGQPIERAIQVNPDVDEADLREFWDRTVAYMAANPLPPGHVWDMVPE